MEKQIEILAEYTNDQLFRQLEKDLICLKNKDLCKVRTTQNLENLIYISFDIFESRGIFINELIDNDFVETKTKQYNKRAIRLYDKVANEMTFTRIGLY